jgi:hypothetical protein
MKDGIVPGARVRVQIPRSSPCPLHCLDAVPEVLEVVGTVDTIVAEWDHPVVVRFGLWHLGSQWIDGFRGDELVLI